MEHPSPQIMSTMSMLKSTIMTDPNAFRWFAFLAGQKAVEKRLAQDHLAREEYTHLNRGFVFETILKIFLIVFLAGLLLFGQVQQVLFLFMAAVILARLNYHLRQGVSRISEKLISGHVDDYELKTFFQITEVLSRVYKVPSFTDTLSAVDNICWRALIGAFALSFLIIPFSLWQALSVIIVTYATVIIGVKSPMALRYIT